MKKHLPKIAGLGAVALIGFAVVSFSLTNSKVSDCATITDRPCFDQQTGQKLLILNSKTGENSFSACWNSTSKGNRGESTLQTSVCVEEQYSYCTEGKSGVVLRNFSGSCGGVDQDSGFIVPPSCTISASPSSISAGTSATISWTTTNATSLFITNIGNISSVSSGSRTVSLLQTTTYTATVSSSDGSSNCSTTVTVNYPVPTISISANPSTILAEGNSTLTWSSTNATSCTASGSWSGFRETSGTETIYAAIATQAEAPAAIRTYTLTCTGQGGTNSKSATVTVNQANTVPVTVIFPNGGECIAGITQISWSSPTSTEVKYWDIGYSTNSGAYYKYAIWLHDPAGRSYNWASYDVDTKTDIDNSQVLLQIHARGAGFPNGTFLGTDWSDNFFQMHPTCPGGSAPVSPLNLVATPTTSSTGEQKVVLTWTDNSTDEVGFAVQKRIPGGNWEAPSVSPSGITYAGLQPSTTYEFRVRAGNRFGYSQVVTVTATTNSQ